MVSTYKLGLCDYETREIEDQGIKIAKKLLTIGEKGNDYNPTKFISNIEDVHKKTLISWIGINNYRKYLTSIISDTIGALVRFRGRRWLEKSTSNRKVLFRNLLNFKNGKSLISKMSKYALNEILFKGALSGDNYKLLEFVFYNGGGAGIDFLRYSIESLTVKDFHRLRYYITQNELVQFKEYALREIREWRYLYDDSFDFEPESRSFDRKKSEILALRWLYRSVLAYADEQRRDITGKGGVDSALDYEGMDSILSSIPFSEKILFKPEKMFFHVFMSGDRFLTNPYIDNILKVLLKMKHYLINKEYQAGFGAIKNDFNAREDLERLKWKISLLEKTEERLRFLAELAIYEGARMASLDSSHTSGYHTSVRSGATPYFPTLPSTMSKMKEQPYKVLDWFHKLYTPPTDSKHKLVGWGRHQYKYFLRSFLLKQTFRTCRYTGIPLTKEMINKGSPNINLNHENMKDPYSMNVGEIMITINAVAVGIGERLDFETQKLIDKKMDELQEKAIHRLESGEKDWKIRKKEFKETFDFELGFFGKSKSERAENRKKLLKYIGLNEKSDIKLTLYDIWKAYEYKIGVVKYDNIDTKLANFNDRIEQFVKDRKALGTTYAYEQLLSDTELANKRRQKSIKQMVNALSVLVGSGYLGSAYLGRILRKDHWNKARLMWNLDIDYPMYSHDYWLFDEGYI